jgi:WhiB family redox-sensing transcriptional regulator
VTAADRAALALLDQVFIGGAVPDWRDAALCAQTDPDAFFPEAGGSNRDAKRICQRCPVQVQCLEDALLRNERHGVWGGMSERQRQKMRQLISSKTTDQDTTEEAA